MGEDERETGSEGTSTDGPLPSAAHHRRTFLVIVDNTDEMAAALAFACRRARATDGRVALLRVIEPQGSQVFAFIDKLMSNEAWEDAEQLLQRMAAEVNRHSGRMPMLYVREGKPVEELLALLEEEPTISVLVLAASSGKDGPGPLVTACGGGAMNKLRVPVTIVPAGMTEEDIQRLA